MIQKRLEDEIFYDNQKDTNKIVNRNVSPDDMHDARIYNSMNIEPVKRRNIEVSKDLPFNMAYYSKEKDLGMTMQIQMEKASKDKLDSTL